MYNPFRHAKYPCRIENRDLGNSEIFLRQKIITEEKFEMVELPGYLYLNF